MCMLALRAARLASLLLPLLLAAPSVWAETVTVEGADGANGAPGQPGEDGQAAFAQADEPGFGASHTNIAQAAGGNGGNAGDDGMTPADGGTGGDATAVSIGSNASGSTTANANALAGVGGTAAWFGARGLGGSATATSSATQTTLGLGATATSNALATAGASGSANASTAADGDTAVQICRAAGGDGRFGSLGTPAGHGGDATAQGAGTAAVYSAANTAEIRATAGDGGEDFRETAEGGDGGDAMVGDFAGVQLSDVQLIATAGWGGDTSPGTTPRSGGSAGTATIGNVDLSAAGPITLTATATAGGPGSGTLPRAGGSAAIGDVTCIGECTLVLEAIGQPAGNVAAPGGDASIGAVDAWGAGSQDVTVTADAGSSAGTYQGPPGIATVGTVSVGSSDGGDVSVALMQHDGRSAQTGHSISATNAVMGSTTGGLTLLQDVESATATSILSVLDDDASSLALDARARAPQASSALAHGRLVSGPVTATATSSSDSLAGFVDPRTATAIAEAGGPAGDASATASTGRSADSTATAESTATGAGDGFARASSDAWDDDDELPPVHGLADADASAAAEAGEAYASADARGVATGRAAASATAASFATAAATFAETFEDDATFAESSIGAGTWHPAIGTGAPSVPYSSAAANAVLLPDAATVSAAIVGSPSVAAALEGRSAVGLARVSGRYHPASAATLPIGFDLALDAPDQGGGDGELLLAFFDGVSPGVRRLELTVRLDGATILSQTLSDEVEAEAFFDDNVVLFALTGAQLQGLLEVDIGVRAKNGESFEGAVLAAVTVPEPGPEALLLGAALLHALARWRGQAEGARGRGAARRRVALR